MGRSSEDDGEIVEIWKNSPIADECVGKDWVNIWNDKKTPNAGENVIVMRCHSHYAALHAHVALARYTSSPKISRLWASSHGWFRPACAPLVETRKCQFVKLLHWLYQRILLATIPFFWEAGVPSCPSKGREGEKYIVNCCFQQLWIVTYHRSHGLLLLYSNYYMLQEHYTVSWAYSFVCCVPL